jgi:pyrroline-5-carboxylate reductase
MKILLAGLGNMGKTYAKSLLASHNVKSTDLFILDRKTYVEGSVHGVLPENTFTAANVFITQAGVIILAVKPQDFPALANAIRPFLHPGQIIVSIMAGITLARIKELLGIDKIIRSMPNLPSQVGMGLTVFTSSGEITKEELFAVQNLINSTGKSVYVEKEEMIDAATAVSGSGPAYVYYFMDAMITSAREMGFQKHEAELLVAQTFLGAIHLQNSGDLSCSDWIQKVASKGGTTEAALKIFNAHGMVASIGSGMEAALKRAQELGQ